MYDRLRAQAVKSVCDDSVRRPTALVAQVGSAPENVEPAPSRARDELLPRQEERVWL